MAPMFWTDDITHSRHMLDVELSLMAQQIAKILERAKFAQSDGSRPLNPHEKDQCRVLAERAVRQTSDMALTLASAAANVALRDRVGFAMRCTIQAHEIDAHAVMHRMATEIERGGADDILAAYEKELSR